MKTTEQMIEVMQGYLDGKPIEYLPKYSNSSPVTMVKPSWQWDSCDYRIKPEPIVRYMVLGTDSSSLWEGTYHKEHVLACQSRNRAEKHGINGPYRIVKLVEGR